MHYFGQGFFLHPSILTSDPLYFLKKRKREQQRREESPPQVTFFVFIVCWRKHVILLGSPRSGKLELLTLLYAEGRRTKKWKKKQGGVEKVVVSNNLDFVQDWRWWRCVFSLICSPVRTISWLGHQSPESPAYLIISYSLLKVTSCFWHHSLVF